MDMLNLKSFESFVDKYAKESLKIHNRLNESVESEKNIYGNIINITNKRCLVVNDYLLAQELEDNKNEVYCLYYDNTDQEYTKSLPKNYQFVDLKQSITDVRKQISKVFDRIWKFNKDLVFDYIINVSPKTQRGLQYKPISELNSFIFCYPFININGKKSAKDERNDRVIIYRRGQSVYYSFDENNVMDEFDRIIYEIRGISVKRGRKINPVEWNKFDKKDKSIRYFIAVFSEDEDDDVINNRNQESKDLDEDDYSWDPEVGRDDDHPFVGMAEPKIYAFESPVVNSILTNRSQGESIKVGDTNRTVSRRIAEWKDKLKDKNIVRLKSWDAVLDGCGEGIDGKIFRDYTIHKLLLEEVNDEYHKDGKKISHVEIEEFPDDYRAEGRYSNEFFRNCSTKDVDHAIDILKERCKENRSKFLYSLKDNSEKDNDVILPLPDEERKPGGFVDRKIQKDTIDGFKTALKKGKKKMLMYAVMRFGKTYVACRCAQEMPKNRFTVIVTAKPGVRNEWTGTVNTNSEFAGYDMYDSTDRKGGLSEMLNKWAEGKEGAEPTLESYFSFEENKNRHILLFSSLQDLFGDTKTTDKITLKPGIKDKHKCFDKFPVDLLVIDECHYGTQTKNFGGVIEEKENPKLKEFMKTLNLDNAVKLYLSGTPYDLLLDNKFDDDEVISAYGFMDIIDAKKDWDREHKEAIEAGNEKWEDNPYFGTPEMLEYGYNLVDFDLNNYSENYDTGFADLFKCHKGEKSGKWEFDHIDDIRNIFEILDGSKKKDGLMSFLDVPEIKKGNMCKHIVITLPNTNCCDALEDLLISEREQFKNFGEYKVVKASTANGTIDTEKVKKLINSHVKAGNKTITLTCDRLLTGVTIKPWDTMFYMKDGRSSQEYDQAKFRIMTPYVKKVKSIDIDKNGNPVKGDATKVNMKPQVLFVDFLPNRIVEMTLDRYEAELTAEGKEDWSNKQIEDRIKKEKGSLTLLLLKNGHFVTGSSDDIGKMVMDMRESRAKAMTFSEVFKETDKLELSAEEIEYLLTHKIKETKDKKTTSKVTKQLRKEWEEQIGPLQDAGTTPPETEENPEDNVPPVSSETTTDSDVENPDVTPEKNERPLSREERLLLMKEEKPKEYKAIINAGQNCRHTIIQNVLMYILLKNRGARAVSGEEDDRISTISEFGDLIDSFNHFGKFNRPDLAKTPEDKIPSQMKENDKIICSIFCEPFGLEEPDYDNPYKVSETVTNILTIIEGWWKIIKRNRHNKGVVMRAWSNMQLKYKQFEQSGKDNFESLRDVLSNYSRLGDTEIITPTEMCPELFKNVVIFNRKDKPFILDCYGGKIGEVFHEVQTNDKFRKITKEDKINGYYLICRNRTIAELNFFVIKNYLRGVTGYGTHEQKRKWFNEHILIYDPTKDTTSIKESNSLTNKFETFSEFMQLVNEGIDPDVDKKEKKEIKRYEDEGGLWSLKKAIENKWGKNMKWDVVIGNPPYGVRQKGNNELHFKIMKTILPFIKKGGKLSFIMPSKPLYCQLNNNWYNMFKNAVCTQIDVQDKTTFSSTKMENTAIYYCEIGANTSKYCKKIDVKSRFENELVLDIEKKYIKYFDTGNTMFKNTFMYRPKSDAKEGFDNYFNIVKEWMIKKYFININNASGSFKGDKYIPGDWISSVCEKAGVSSYNDEIDFLLKNDGRKMILQFDTYNAAKNLFELLHHPLLRFGLWLQQYSQDMQKECYKYFPDLDYSEIDTDEKLLEKLGCKDPKEQKEILDYVNNFDFTQKRNDRFLKSEDSVEPESSPSSSESSKSPSDMTLDELKDNFKEDYAKWHNEETEEDFETWLKHKHPGLFVKQSDEEESDN